MFQGLLFKIFNFFQNILFKDFVHKNRRFLQEHVFKGNVVLGRIQNVFRKFLKIKNFLPNKKKFFLNIYQFAKYPCLNLLNVRFFFKSIRPVFLKYLIFSRNSDEGLSGKNRGLV